MKLLICPFDNLDVHINLEILIPVLLALEVVAIEIVVVDVAVIVVLVVVCTYWPFAQMIFLFEYSLKVST